MIRKVAEEHGAGLAGLECFIHAIDIRLPSILRSEPTHRNALLTVEHQIPLQHRRLGKHTPHSMAIQIGNHSVHGYSRQNGLLFSRAMDNRRSDVRKMDSGAGQQQCGKTRAEPEIFAAVALV